MKDLSHKIDCVIANGDSYSEPLADDQSWSKHVAQAWALPIHNYALYGSSNDRICRSTITHVSQCLSSGKRPFVFVAWSFIRRIEIWNYSDRPFHWERHESSDCKFVPLDLMINKNSASLEERNQIMPDLHIHKKLTDFYTSMYLLAHWFEQHNIPYLFFSGANNTDCPTNCFSYIDNLPTTRWCNCNPKIFKIHSFSIPTWSKENDPDHSVTGHLSAHGHDKFGTVIRKLTESLYEVV